MLATALKQAEPVGTKKPLHWLAWTIFGSYAAFIACVIWIMDSGRGRPIYTLVGQVPYGDKLGHFVLIGLLCLLLNLALKGKTTPVMNRLVLTGSAWLGLIVVLEEISQRFIEHRTFDLVDLAADFAGILVAGVLARRLLRADGARDNQT